MPLPCAPLTILRDSHELPTRLPDDPSSQLKVAQFDQRLCRTPTDQFGQLLHGESLASRHPRLQNVYWQGVGGFPNGLDGWPSPADLFEHVVHSLDQSRAILYKAV